MSMERGTQLKSELGSGSRGKLLMEFDTVFEEIGKRLKSELDPRSGSIVKRVKELRSISRGKLLMEFDIVLQEIGKQLKSELASRSGSLGKRLKESESGSRWERPKEFEERGKRMKESGSRGKRLNEWGSGSRGERLKEFEERGKRLKSELGSRSGSGSRGKRLKSEPESKQKPDGDPVEIDYENSPTPHIYYRGNFVYTNNAWKKMEAEIREYEERSRHLSAYDVDLAGPPPDMNSFLAPCGGCAPFPITDDNRPTLITLCKLALKDYNQKNNNQGTSFVFHQLVKCATGMAGLGELYYITFQAEEEDPSNSPAITTFQTSIWHAKNKEPEVQECAIKT